MPSIRFSGPMKVLLKAAISAALLAWFLMRTDREQLVSAFAAIPIWLWPMLFGMYVVSQFISTTRWYMLAGVLGFSESWLTYLNYYFSGMFFNLFLPTSIGGDVMKVFFISRGQGARAKMLASYSVLADRLLGLCSLLIMGAVAVLASPGILPPPFSTLLIWSGACVLLALFSAPLTERLVGGRLGAMVEKILRILLVFWKHPRVLVICLFFSAIVQGICIYICILIGRAMGIEVPVLLYFAAFPLVALLTMIPISFSGIGVREGGFVYFLGLHGVPSAQAMMLSLGFFAVQVAASLVGGIVYSTGSYKKTGIDS